MTTDKTLEAVAEIYIPEGYVLVSVDNHDNIQPHERRMHLFVSKLDWDNAPENYSAVGGYGKMVPIICHKPIASISQAAYNAPRIASKELVDKVAEVMANGWGYGTHPMDKAKAALRAAGFVVKAE